eukprot:1710565-Amphidinium_carterae.1
MVGTVVAQQMVVQASCKSLWESLHKRDCNHATTTYYLLQQQSWELSDSCGMRFGAHISASAPILSLRCAQEAQCSHSLSEQQFYWGHGRPRNRTSR